MQREAQCRTASGALTPKRARGGDVDDENRQAPMELLAIAGNGEDREDCPGTTGDGTYLKVMNGMPLDSGSAAFVMPESWFPGVPAAPSLGSRSGQRFIGAIGTVKADTGQKRMEFRTAEGQDRRCTLQTADLTTMLERVAGFADGAGAGKGNYRGFDSKRCVIASVAPTQVILPENLSLLTYSNRKGNTYVMDIWLNKKEKALGKKGVVCIAVGCCRLNMPFTGPTRRWPTRIVRLTPVGPLFGCHAR